jgi:hypothetical protein
LFAVVAAIVVTGAPPAWGQVGYPPERSPFRDLEYRQELSLYSGYYQAQLDPEGISPQSGPLVGVRYELRIGGPMQLSVRMARVSSERTIIDPGLAEEARAVATRDLGLYLVDAGFTFNLTGQKSWHGLVPLLSAGGGIVSDFKGTRDVGGFRIGTPFAISLGGGVRWVPSGPYQVRLDVLSYWYEIRYPSTYFTATPPNSPVRTGSQSVWTRNLAFTLGASYQFFR